MEANINSCSNYNFCELTKDVLNGPNGKYIIGCGTIIALVLISRGFSFKTDQLTLTIPSVCN